MVGCLSSMNYVGCVAHFDILSWHVPRETEENHTKH